MAKNSVVKKRQEQFKRAAASAGGMPLEKTRCHKHPDRYAATSIPELVCWECFHGRQRFRQLFKADAEAFYKPGGPGWAGDS